MFDLPPGYTVNSIDAGIVDNIYVPEPSSALLVTAPTLKVATCDASAPPFELRKAGG